MIKTENLSRHFNSVTALNALTLNVNEGEIFGLVGPDGAGKTTTMRLLASVLMPSSGDAWVGGFHTVRDAEQVKRLIAYMPQRFGLYEDLTVEENLRFYADIYQIPSKECKPRMDALLAMTRLDGFPRRLAKQLSGGMKQKLGLACALVHTPRVLFLDEPTNGVDPISRREFWVMLTQLLQEKVTIFFSTSYLDEAQRCHRIGLLYKGKLLRCDTPGAIKKEQGTDSLEGAFRKLIV